MFPQENFEWPARKLLQGLLEVMHAEQKKSKSGGETPGIEFYRHDHFHSTTRRAA
jgi:hypothetical protein